MMTFSKKSDGKKKRSDSLSGKRRHFVYILQTSNGRYYTGYTTDLQKRMEAHKRGKGSKCVRGFGFGRLCHHEAHPTKSRALKREAEIKKWSRAEKEALCLP